MIDIDLEASGTSFDKQTHQEVNTSGKRQPSLHGLQDAIAKVFMSVLHDTSVSCKTCINNNYLIQLNFLDCFGISLGRGCRLESN